MKQRFILAIAMLMAWSISAMAQSVVDEGNFGTDDGLHWAVTGESSNYTLTITRNYDSESNPIGDGESGWDDENMQAWETYNSGIKTVDIKSGVTKVGKNSFAGLTNLTDVTIGEDVAIIRHHAFYHCNSLTEIEIPCAVTEIEAKAFYECTNLASVTVHRYYPTTPQITTVSNDAVFVGCASGLTIHVPCSLYTEDTNWRGYATVATFEVETMTPCTNPWVVTPPTANEGLYYDGSPQELLATAGKASHGQMAYRIGTSGDWSTTLPTATEIDQYDVYYGVYYNSAYSDAFGSIPVNIHLRANEDPQGPGEYYSTFFYSSANYTIPANTEAYIAKIQNSTSLKLTKIAETNDIIPANNAFIIKAEAEAGHTTYLIKMNSTTDDATVSVEEGSNDLRGSDDEQSYPDANAYILSGRSDDNVLSGAGFYKLATGTAIPAHKAYVVLPSGGSSAPPRRLAFVYNSLLGATGMEEVVSDQQPAVSVQKVLIDGQLYLMYDGKMYDVRGQLVK